MMFSAPAQHPDTIDDLTVDGTQVEDDGWAVLSDDCIALARSRELSL
jgi:hypothetical protein